LTGDPTVVRLSDAMIAFPGPVPDRGSNARDWAASAKRLLDRRHLLVVPFVIVPR
jgi:hypothetical protein